MLAHLHLHLEPERRKRIQMGLAASEPSRDKRAFFAAHDVGNGARLPVTGQDLRDFIVQVHAEQRREGVDYVELRLSPRRFLLDGLPTHEFVHIAAAAMQPLRRPIVRGVLLVNRDSTPDVVARCAAMLADLPATFVGIDLAGDESHHGDTTRFRALFSTARDVGLGITVHAGEFGDLASTWRALDELGAQRIGHGLAAAQSRSLLKRLSDDHVMVELSISSNRALGAVTETAPHPARAFLEAGVPICFNTDIPLESRSTLQQELALAATALEVTTAELTAIQQKAAVFAFRSDLR
ncbi:adenosine deaminase family protein [Micromonospora foliorum]|uniref:adenosine deaminase family protein n=1 Tax=Micromonospora foliorum TaxID=2911210 RepID=UPI001EE78D9C|nr:hypothetical protein [Micromonospora foliorum]MCG5437024.1 hypothetical protein [Micromonospora foliorum]